MLPSGFVATGSVQKFCCPHRRASGSRQKRISDAILMRKMYGTRRWPAGFWNSNAAIQK